MATNSVLEYKFDDHHVKEEEEEEENEELVEEEEEALSLCDLPVTDKATKQDTHQIGEKEEHEENKDFDFNSFCGILHQEPEMCAADEVFFQGQILPLRHSFSSEHCSSSSITKELQINKQFNGCESRESMDHEFGSSSSSSRSGSLRSQNSSSSTSSTIIRVSKPKIRNQFHTIPSPKPQLRQSRSGTRQTILNFSNQGRKSSSSSAWEFFRLGVAPAPEMLGLQDLKLRNNGNCVSRNSSSSSSNNSNSCKAKSSVKKLSNRKSGGGGGGLLSGCSCSVDSVVSQLETVMIKSTSNKRTTESVATSHAMKEKVVAKLKKHNNNNNINIRQKQQTKKVLSRRRTFEWLKELHAIRRPEDEEALLSSNT